jgi:hypothetical protein
MYGLYSAYGGKLSKIYWWLFKNVKIIRWINSMDENRLGFPYTLIKEIDGEDTLMSFNMGSPGVEQKISILGYNNRTHQPFFAKFTQKLEAMILSKNEIDALNQLKGLGFTPTLFDYKISSDYVYLKTEYIEGNRPKNMLLTRDILELTVRLSHLNHTNKIYNNDGLRLSLSHGDFCPWNFLENNGRLRLIDWEMLQQRTLGYDLFTYIFQGAFLFSKKDPVEILKSNQKWIKLYFDSFGINDYNPYIIAFVQEKSDYEKKKKNENNRLADQYDNLRLVLSNLKIDEIIK